MILRNVAVLIILCTLMCSIVEAGKPRRWRRRPAPQRPYQANSQVNSLPAGRYYPGPPWQRATDDYYRAAYPKYYGGFHVRQLQNIGIPDNSGLGRYGFSSGAW